MATYYVWSGATGANNGTSWADAYTTLGAAVTASTAAGDIIKVHKSHTETLSGDTSYTFPANVSVLCVDKDAGDAPAVMGDSAWIGHDTLNRRLTITGARILYIYGLTFRVSGTTADDLAVGATAGAIFTLEKCFLWHSNTGAGAGLKLAHSSGSIVSCVDCTYSFSSVAGIVTSGVLRIRGFTLYSGSSQPPALFTVNGAGSGDVTVTASDLSALTGAIVGSMPNYAALAVTLIGCKLAAGAVIRSAGSQGPTAWLFNCASGDENYQFGHYNNLGETVVSTAIYANDGAEYNAAAAKYSWKITTSAEASLHTPYISPWIHTHNETLTAITPSLEILRDGSATAYQDDDVWGEFSYQGTAGFPMAVLVNDRMTLLGTPANQATGALSASGWTGENATAWFGKLAPNASITPAEIGPLSARVCVGEPSITVYVDPQIRV